MRPLLGFGLALFSLVALVAIAVAGFYVSLPDPRLLKGCLTTTMYHVRLCDSDPGFVQLGSISPYITGAVVMSEDASFNFHQGIDFTELKESVIRDWNEGRFARGASTITQQLAKNVFLTKEKSLFRKLKEMYLAVQIEKILSKPRILTLYLNVVQFGPDLFGVKAATNYYFHKQPNDVSPEEAAFLAFLLPNPEKYSINFKQGRLTPFSEKTVRTILHKMQLGHKITDPEYEAAIARIPYFPWGPNAPVEQEQPVATDGTGEDRIVPTEIIDQTEDDFKFDFEPEEDKPLE